MCIIIQNQPAGAGPSPPDYYDKQVSFLLPVLFDSVPSGQHFGSVHKEPSEKYCIVSYVCTSTQQSIFIRLSFPE